MKHLLYTNEVVVINSLHPCFLTLLPIIDGPAPRTVDSPRKVGLRFMEFNHDVHCMYNACSLMSFKVKVMI